MSTEQVTNNISVNIDAMSHSSDNLSQLDESLSRKLDSTEAYFAVRKSEVLKSLKDDLLDDAVQHLREQRKLLKDFILSSDVMDHIETLDQLFQKLLPVERAIKVYWKVAAEQKSKDEISLALKKVLEISKTNKPDFFEKLTDSLEERPKDLAIKEEGLQLVDEISKSSRSSQLKVVTFNERIKEAAKFGIIPENIEVMELWKLAKREVKINYSEALSSLDGLLAHSDEANRTLLGFVHSLRQIYPKLCDFCESPTFLRVSTSDLGHSALRAVESTFEQRAGGEIEDYMQSLEAKLVRLIEAKNSGKEGDLGFEILSEQSRNDLLSVLANLESRLAIDESLLSELGSFLNIDDLPHQIYSLEVSELDASCGLIRFPASNLLEHRLEEISDKVRESCISEALQELSKKTQSLSEFLSNFNVDEEVGFLVDNREVISLLGVLKAYCALRSTSNYGAKFGDIELKKFSAFKKIVSEAKSVDLEVYEKLSAFSESSDLHKIDSEVKRVLHSLRNRTLRMLKPKVDSLAEKLNVVSESIRRGLLPKRHATWEFFLESHMGKLAEDLYAIFDSKTNEELSGLISAAVPAMNQLQQFQKEIRGYGQQGEIRAPTLRSLDAKERQRVEDSMLRSINSATALYRSSTEARLLRLLTAIENEESLASNKVEKLVEQLRARRNSEILELLQPLMQRLICNSADLNQMGEMLGIDGLAEKLLTDQVQEDTYQPLALLDVLIEEEKSAVRDKFISDELERLEKAYDSVVKLLELINLTPYFEKVVNPDSSIRPLYDKLKSVKRADFRTVAREEAHGRRTYSHANTIKLKEVIAAIENHPGIEDIIDIQKFKDNKVAYDDLMAVKSCLDSQYRDQFLEPLRTIYCQLEEVTADNIKLWYDKDASLPRLLEFILRDLDRAGVRNTSFTDIRDAASYQKAMQDLTEVQAELSKSLLDLITDPRDPEERERFIFEMEAGDLAENLKRVERGFRSSATARSLKLLASVQGDLKVEYQSKLLMQLNSVGVDGVIDLISKHRNRLSLSDSDLKLIRELFSSNTEEDKDEVDSSADQAGKDLENDSAEGTNESANLEDVEWIEIYLDEYGITDETVLDTISHEVPLSHIRLVNSLFQEVPNDARNAVLRCNPALLQEDNQSEVRSVAKLLGRIIDEAQGLEGYKIFNPVDNPQFFCTTKDAERTLEASQLLKNLRKEVEEELFPKSAQENSLEVHPEQDLIDRLSEYFEYPAVTYGMIRFAMFTRGQYSTPIPKVVRRRKVQNLFDVNISPSVFAIVEKQLIDVDIMSDDIEAARTSDHLLKLVHAGNISDKKLKDLYMLLIDPDTQPREAKKLTRY